MKTQSLVVVVLRLMALNFLLSAIVKLAWGTLGPVRVGLPLLILTLASAVLVWVLALPIARLVTRGISQDISFGAMSLVDCYSIAFIGVGLIYATGHLPQVLNWAHYLFKVVASGLESAKGEVDFYQVSEAFIPFIVGVVLIVKGRSWAIALAQRQEKEESPNQITGANAG